MPDSASARTPRRCCAVESDACSSPPARPLERRESRSHSASTHSDDQAQDGPAARDGAGSQPVAALGIEQEHCEPVHRSASRSGRGRRSSCSLAALQPTVRRTPGISCERPIRSTLVCFIPLFDGAVRSLTLRRAAPPASAQAVAQPCPLVGAPLRRTTRSAAALRHVHERARAMHVAANERWHRRPVSLAAATHWALRASFANPSIDAR